MALSLCLANPISSKNMALMTGVLQIIEKMFIMTAKALESNPT